jgi:hypothetical protein
MDPPLTGTRINVRGLNGKYCKSFLESSIGIVLAVPCTTLVIQVPARSSPFFSLFTFPTPTLVPPDYVPGKRLVIPAEMADQTAIKDKSILPASITATARERFFYHIMDVLTCNYTYRNFKTGEHKDTAWFQFTRTLNAIAVWTCFILQLAFPVISLAALGCVFTDWYCTLRLGDCYFAPVDESPSLNGL